MTNRGDGERSVKTKHEGRAFQYLSIINVPKKQEEITSEIPPRDQRAPKWFSLQLAVIERCPVETAKATPKRKISSISRLVVLCIIRKYWEISSLVSFPVAAERRGNCAEIW